MPSTPKDRVEASAFGCCVPPQGCSEPIPVVAVVGEHGRKFVSLVRPYLGMHFIAASEVECFGSGQADQ